MKRNRFYSIIGVSIICFFSISCSNDSNLSDITTNEKEKTIVISVGISNNDSVPNSKCSRVAYDDSKIPDIPSKSGNPFSWENGDKIVLVGSNDKRFVKCEEFSIKTIDASKQNATFEGKFIDGATSYKVYYPSNNINKSTGEPINAVLNTQVQSGNNNTDHLKNSMLFAASPVLSNNIFTNFNMGCYSSIMKFVLTNVPSEISQINKLEWRIEDSNGNSKIMSMKLSNIYNSNNTITCYMSFIPNKMILGANNSFIVTLTGSNNKTCEFRVISTNGKTYIPNSRITAKCNKWTIDAITPKYNYTINDYYQWDAINHYGSSNDATYNQNNLAVNTCKNAPTKEDIIKYLSAGVYWDNGQEGDNKQAYSIDGTVYYTGLWLKKKQYISTDTTFIEKNAIAGIKPIIGRPSNDEIGKYFFIPALGRYDVSSYTGSSGFYWTQTKVTNNPNRAYTLQFNCNKAYMPDYNCGFPFIPLAFK